MPENTVCCLHWLPANVKRAYWKSALTVSKKSQRKKVAKSDFNFQKSKHIKNTNFEERGHIGGVHFNSHNIKEISDFSFVKKVGKPDFQTQ